jgi:hypothetical protein
MTQNVQMTQNLRNSPFKRLPSDVLRFILNEFLALTYTLEHDEDPIKSLFGRFENEKCPFLVFTHVFFDEVDVDVFKYNAGKFYPKFLRTITFWGPLYNAETSFTFYFKSFPNLQSLSSSFSFKWSKLEHLLIDKKVKELKKKINEWEDNDINIKDLVKQYEEKSGDPFILLAAQLMHDNKRSVLQIRGAIMRRHDLVREFCEKK